MDATHYPDNYDDQQHGRDLVIIIRKDDVLELFNGTFCAARFEMQERGIAYDCSVFMVSAWVEFNGTRGAFPIDSNAIVAVWRNGNCVYRMGEPLPQQMELFSMESVA